MYAWHYALISDGLETCMHGNSAVSKHVYMAL